MFEVVVVRKVLKNSLFAILQSCDAGDIACLLKVYRTTIVFEFLSCGGASRTIIVRFADEVWE